MATKTRKELQAEVDALYIRTAENSFLAGHEAGRQATLLAVGHMLNELPCASIGVPAEDDLHLYKVWIDELNGLVRNGLKPPPEKPVLPKERFGACEDCGGLGCEDDGSSCWVCGGTGKTAVIPACWFDAEKAENK